MVHAQLDNKLFIKLPEGVSINLMPAGITVRACAYLYDFVIRAVILLLLMLAFRFLGQAGEGLTLIAFFIISWGYYIFFEARTGNTPGKKKFRLQVVQDNGLPANLSHIIIRNLLRPADAFPFAYCLGILTMAFNTKFKRIGDWASGTMVVHTKPEHQDPEFDEFTPLAPPMQLSTQEQQAIILFAERSKELSPARQEELAKILPKQLLTNKEGASQQLKQMARFYLGQGI
ncbi:RDD family protein [Thalassotalea sp. PLHSN55]|uniref:RDD family protein n=1 Tax=Thalassotalea sp. PLHSN55 TaxID=3435888 RepID=UPI003F87B099